MTTSTHTAHAAATKVARFVGGDGVVSFAAPALIATATAA